MATAAKTVVACSHCGAKNRVNLDATVDRLPVCGACKKPLPAPSSSPVTVTDGNFGQTVENSSLTVLLDMWAAWCGPCRIIAPTIETLARELAGKVLVGKLDVDSNPVTTAKYSIRNIPTILFMKNGEIVDKQVGAVPKSVLVGKLEKLLG